jgi:hypothetical protein
MIDEEGRLSTVQKGKAVEALVASTLILASDGRLSPCVPVSDDCGIDLLVFDKITHRILPIQIKSRIANPSRQTVQFNVGKATLGDLPNRFLLGVLLDPESISMTASWLIPMARLSEVSTEKLEMYSVKPSFSADTRDRCRMYRHDTASDLTAAILKAVNRERAVTADALAIV